PLTAVVEPAPRRRACALQGPPRSSRVQGVQGPQVRRERPRARGGRRGLPRRGHEESDLSAGPHVTVLLTCPIVRSRVSIIVLSVGLIGCAASPSTAPPASSPGASYVPDRVCLATSPSGGPALTVHGCACARELECTAQVSGHAIAITARESGEL